MRRELPVIGCLSSVTHALDLGLQVHRMNDAREGEVVGSFLPVVGDEVFEPDGVDVALALIFVQEHLDIPQAPSRFKFMAPTAVHIGQFPEAGLAALRDIVLLAAVDEYVRPGDGLTGLVDDPDIDGAPRGRKAEGGDKESEGE
jgi:hypothetical protein